MSIPLKKKKKKAEIIFNLVIVTIFISSAFIHPRTLLNLLSPNIFAQDLGLCSEHSVLRLRRQPIEKLAGISVEGGSEMSITKRRKMPICFYFFEEETYFPISSDDTHVTHIRNVNLKYLCCNLLSDLTSSVIS